MNINDAINCFENLVLAAMQQGAYKDFQTLDNHRAAVQTIKDFITLNNSTNGNQKESGQENDHKAGEQTSK